MKSGYTGPQTEAEFIAEVEACPRPRGYMGGGTVGGGDPDDADRAPNVPPTTVAEWVAQTRETGILEFEKLIVAAATERRNVLLEASKLALSEGENVRDHRVKFLAEHPEDNFALAMNVRANEQADTLAKFSDKLEALAYAKETANV
jgi:hypothetical protein